MFSFAPHLKKQARKWANATLQLQNSFPMQKRILFLFFFTTRLFSLSVTALEFAGPVARKNGSIAG